MWKSSRHHLVDGDLESRELVHPAVVRSLVEDTLVGADALVIGPQGTHGPGAELLVGALVGAGIDGAVQASGGRVILHPGNDGGEQVISGGVRAIGLSAVL